MTSGTTCDATDQSRPLRHASTNDGNAVQPPSHSRFWCSSRFPRFPDVALPVYSDADVWLFGHHHPVVTP